MLRPSTHSVWLALGMSVELHDEKDAAPPRHTKEAGQATQMRGLGKRYLPGAHVVATVEHSALPASETWPAGQASQSLDCVVPLLGFFVLAGHGVHAPMAKDGPYEPAGHAAHAALAAREKVPGAQMPHADEPALALKRPAGHCAQMPPELA